MFSPSPPRVMNQNNMKKRIYYEVYAEGESNHYKFYKYERLLDFVWQFIPRWHYKLRVYKVKNGLTFVGKFVQNNRYPIKF